MRFISFLFPCFYLCLKIDLFFAVMFYMLVRSDDAHNVEEIIQNWKLGMLSRIWITVDVLIDNCPGLALKLWKSYEQLTCGRLDIHRGFFTQTTRYNNISHIFIINKSDQST